MSKVLKRILIGSSILFILAIVIFIFLYSSSTIVDKAVIRALNSFTGENAKIKYMRISGNLLGNVRIDSLTIQIYEDTLFFKQVDINYSLFDAVKRKFYLNSINIIQPSIILRPKQIRNLESDTLKTTSTDSLISNIIFDRLPEIQIKELTLHKGSLLIYDKDHAEIFENIDLKLSCRKNRKELELNVKDLSFHWKNRNQYLENLSFYFSGDREGIVLQQFKIQSNNLDITGNGEVILNPETQIFIFVKGGTIDLSLLKSLSLNLPFDKGRLNISGSFQGLPYSFSGDLSFNGILDSLQIKECNLSYNRKNNSLRLSDINFISNFGILKGEVQASPNGNNMASLLIKDVNLEKMGIYTQETKISGNIDFKFEKWDFKKLSGYGNLELDSIQFGQTYMDSLKLSIVANQGDYFFEKPSKLVFADDSEFLLAGSFTKQENLDIQLKTSRNRLDKLFQKIGITNLGGVGSLNLKLTGYLKNPDLHGLVLFDSLVYSEMKVYGVGGNINIKGIFDERIGTFNLDINQGMINDFKLTEGYLHFSVNKNQVQIDTINFYSDKNNILIQGMVELQNDTVSIDLYNLQLQYENYVIRNDTVLQLILSQDTLHFTKFELNAANSGSIHLKGNWVFPKSGNLNLEVVNTRLEPFNQFINWKYKVKGTVDGSLKYSGAISNPEITTSLQLNDVLLDTFPLGSINTSINYKNKQIEFDKFQYTYRENSYLTINGKISLIIEQTDKGTKLFDQSSADLSLTALNLRLQDYAFLLDINYPFQGNISSAIILKGTFKEPQGFIKLTGKNVSISKFDFPYFNLVGRISPQNLFLDKGLINFANTEISAIGFKTINWDFPNLKTVYEDNTFGLLCKIEEDSVNFLSTVLPDVDRIIGDISVEAKFGGSIKRPMLFDGDIKIDNGLLYITKIENPVKNISFQAHVEENTVIIDKFNGQSPIPKPKKNIFKDFLNTLTLPFRKVVLKDYGDGDIDLTGSVDFAYLNHPKLDLHASLNDAYFNYFLENMSLVVNSKDIWITGRDTFIVTGDVVAKKGNWDIDFLESEKNILLSKSIRQKPPFVQYKLDVEIPNNFFARSNMPFNSFDIELEGRVQIIREPKQALEMNGQLKILPGGKYFVQVEDFNVNSGQINYVNPKEYPELNLTATKRKNDYLFELSVNGPLDNPVKEMYTRNLITNEEFHDLKDQMTLLLFGVEFKNLSGLSDSALVASGGGLFTQTLLNQLEREALQFSGLDRIHFGTQESLDYFSRLPWENNQQTSSLSLGKYFTPDLYLEYQAKLSSTNVSGLGSVPTPSLSWESGNLVYIKYRLTKNWALSSFYQRTVNGNDKVRFDVSWQLSF